MSGCVILSRKKERKKRRQAGASRDETSRDQQRAAQGTGEAAESRRGRQSVCAVPCVVRALDAH